ncbi:hypothetical protein ACWEQL_15490 [Kitasatospora sp. NPDC004240]
MPPAAGARGLSVTRAFAADFEGHSETSLDPDLRVFTGDLARPYGLEPREDLLREGVGHAYGEMGRDLLQQALADGPPVDLLILAFSSPDVRPGAPAALYLSRHCPGTPTAFAVCDQGSAAAFTALRLAAVHHRTGGCRRAAVVLAEQSALHHRPAEPVELPERHRAVLLLCEESAGEGIAVRQSARVDGEGARAAVREEHRALGPDAELLLAAGLSGEDGVLEGGAPEGGPVTAAAPGQPFTGLWTLLAERLPARTADAGPLLLADHDHRLGRLSTLTLP